MPSVMTSTCLRDSGESSTARPAALRALPRGVLPFGIDEAAGQIFEGGGIKRPEGNRRSRRASL